MRSCPYIVCREWRRNSRSFFSDFAFFLGNFLVLRILANRFSTLFSCCILLAELMRKHVLEHDSGLFGDWLTSKSVNISVIVALATVRFYAGRRVRLLYDDHLQVAAGSANAGMRRRSCGRLVTGGEAN